MGYIVESKIEATVDPVLPMTQEKVILIQSNDPFVIDQESIEKSKKVYFQIED